MNPQTMLQQSATAATGRARKDPKMLIEPNKSGYQRRWEGHHATNPCSIRLSTDPRVFLGYRAGGDDDVYYNHHWKVWGSHLGLAILDEQGEAVVARLPLPIFHLEHDVALPQSPEEFEVFVQGPHAKENLVLHDFRFFEYRANLYVVYHAGDLETCSDCVARMSVVDFLKRIERSQQLASMPTEEIIDEWRTLWWAPGVWEPCGYNGTDQIFPSKINKGDTLFYELTDGTLQMCHRPLAFGNAVLNTGDKFYVEPTEDGLTRYGVFESNTRPGYLDNSHIGNNGRPTLAMIGQTRVYIDIVHGCWRDFPASRINKPHIMYYAYLRVRCAQTGRLLYYSEEPVIDYGPGWDAYGIEGEWVVANPALRGVMFAGGQEEVLAGCNGLDDEWVTYVGLGDTAVGLARFTLRELMPAQVIADIEALSQPQTEKTQTTSSVSFDFPQPINGWNWSIRNNPQEGTLEIVRTLPTTGETAVRPVVQRPGYFDAHGLSMKPEAVHLDEELNAWVVVYEGTRNGQSAHGLLMLWGFNPEQILFRSVQPLEDDNASTAQILENYRAWVPQATLSDISYMNLYHADKIPFPSQMEIWQRQKAGLES